MGVNVKTGNFGFLTNYDHKVFKMIKDQKFRKGRLMIDYLKSPDAMVTDEDFETYLKTFLEFGDEFNGTNILLGNLTSDDLPFSFANNYSSDKELPKYEYTVNEGGVQSFSNGERANDWGKETLGKELLMKLFENTDDIDVVKDIAFRVA